MLRTRNVLNLLAGILLLTILSSCNYVKKTDDKIVGLWSTESVVDGTEATEYFKFKSDGTFVHLCEMHSSDIPGFVVSGTWKIGPMRSRMKLTYDLSSLKSFWTKSGEPDSEKTRSVLKAATEEISAAAGKEPILVEFNDSDNRLTLNFPGIGEKKFSKDSETDIDNLLASNVLEGASASVAKTEKAPEAEEPEMAAPVAPVAPAACAAPAILRDGLNILDGQFRFQGNDYGFIVTFKYDVATGKAYDPTYEAAGYGNQSKLSSITVANDEKTLTLTGTASGTKTSIVADYAGGSRYTGRMTRGSNNGTCVLTLH